VILTPYAQNPTGASWSAERTQELRAVVTKYRDALIVEDDYLSPFYDELQTLSSDERPRWAVIRSVSKYIGPDLRFAYICGSNDTVRAVRGMRSFTSRWVTRIVQQCVLQVLSDPATPALFAQAAKTYAERQAAMMAALAKRGIGAMGNTGINVWIPVPNEDAFSLALHRRGWAVRTGSIFRLASPPALRVATSRLTPAQVESFADDLAAIFSEPPVDYGA
jgi:DNA-binding transcriptional MocR family regulator